jgi:ABC-type nitrate/sulfonate/bicarbonate transport system substrate-binding protein
MRLQRLTKGTLTAVALAFAVAPRAEAQIEHATIALPAIAGIFASDYIAQDAGIYKKNGLDVKEELIAGIGAANAVISGSIDFSQSSGPTITRAAAHGQRLIAIANTYDRSGFWIVVSKKIAEERHFDPKAPLAERAKIMKGLRFSIGAFHAIPDAYLRVIAKAGGIDPSEMTLTAIAPTDTVPAMKEGAIDGFSAGPPQLEEAIDSGLGVVVADGNDAPVDPPWLSHVAANVVLVRPETCAKNRSLCEKMGRSMADANAFLHEHPKQSMAILAKRLNITDQKVLAEAYKSIAEASPSPPVSDAKEFETAEHLNVEAGFMNASDKAKSYQDMFTNEYLKDGE